MRRSRRFRSAWIRKPESQTPPSLPGWTDDKGALLEGRSLRDADLRGWFVHRCTRRSASIQNISSSADASRDVASYPWPPAIATLAHSRADCADQAAD